MSCQRLLQQFAGLLLLGWGLLSCGSGATPAAGLTTPTSLTPIAPTWQLTSPLTLFEARGTILSVAFSPDGQTLAVATSTGFAAELRR